MKRILFFSLAATFLAIAAGSHATPPGYRLIEAAAASVNSEVIFLSDVSREACFYRCGAVPGQPASEMSLADARQKLVSDMLILQEQRKLGLGTLDNAAVSEAAGRIESAMGKCSSPCRDSVSRKDAVALASRRMLVREFLESNVAVFIEVNDEEVRRERDARERAGAPPAELSEEKIKRDLFSGKASVEIGNWFTRAASKSRIVLSPLPEP